MVFGLSSAIIIGKSASEINSLAALLAQLRSFWFSDHPITGSPDSSSLAFGAVMRSSSAHYNFLDGSFADQTRLSFASVDPVLELEKALFSISINVVRDR